MLTRFLLPISLLAATAAAQNVLLYDNGPLQTAPTRSSLQNAAPHSLTVYGYGAATSSGYSCLDDFAVSAAMVINEVEVFFYQTGSTTTSTITGVFLEFYNANPSTGAAPMAGSPGIATNLLTATSTNVWSGLYRDLIGTVATNRPIMAIRVALPTPLTLTSGVYWIQMQASGSLTSGPWLPPITVLENPVTGNGMQKLATTGAFTNPILSGIHPQGLPFRFYGPASAVPGSIVNVHPAGCGAHTLTVTGAPNMGGFLRSEIGGVTGLGMIGYGFTVYPVPIPFCGCNVGHSWNSVAVTTVSSLTIPMSMSLAGLSVGIQGLDLGAAPVGCPTVPVQGTDTYQVTINM